MTGADSSAASRLQPAVERRGADSRPVSRPLGELLPRVRPEAVVLAVSRPGDLVAGVAAGVALGGLCFAIGAFSPGSIGMGDAKLGLPGVLAVGVWLILTQAISPRKKTIPFGPFLSLGGIIGFFLT